MTEGPVVERVEVPVLYVRTRGGAAAASIGFALLEGAVGRARLFYGWELDDEFRACVVRAAGDDPAALGLDEGLLPAGPWAVARHEGPVESVAETFAFLARRHVVDRTRPRLQEFRGGGEVWVYLPITAGTRGASERVGLDMAPLSE